MAPTTAIAWFRRDLRTHDNPVLAAAAAADRLLPVYCVDPREYGPAAYGGSDSFAYEKTGPYRARFLTEALADLRTRLRRAGSDLVVRRGRPEAVLPALASEVGADVVHAAQYPTSEEQAVRARVGAALPEGVALRPHWGHTLYDPADLPDGGRSVDDTFTTFRHAVEDSVPIRAPADVPSLPPCPDVGPGPVPAPTALGETDGELPGAAAAAGDPERPDERGVLPFEGGETAALARLEQFVWETDSLRTYRETRNGLVGRDYSSKLSPWLAAGCLSPRRVNAAVERYEAERVANESTYWLVFELRWRDFFQFQFRKHGDAFFSPGGIRERRIDWRDDADALARWCRGETGVPFVDANMRELAATGYMSNRGRQNVASFLANDLRIDWRRGAAHFETLLVDYDPASNYGNWAYVAGVGNDARDRSFDVVGQARHYDPDAEYVTRWLPELAGLSAEHAHAPWTLSGGQQARHGVELGVDYPEPIVDPATL